MPRSFTTLGLTSLACMSIVIPQPAQAEKTVEACANQLKARGYNVISMDIDDGRIYDFEAIKANQKWEIKTDMNCKVLLEQKDY